MPTTYIHPRYCGAVYNFRRGDDGQGKKLSFSNPASRGVQAYTVSYTYTRRTQNNARVYERICAARMSLNTCVSAIILYYIVRV